LPGELRSRDSLASLTTMGVGGEAYSFSPSKPESLRKAISKCRENGWPYLLLGGGSNILFADSGFPGLILSTKKLRGMRIEEKEAFVFAGEPLPSVLNHLNRVGIPSLNYLSGIPGSLGGAVAMNAGTAMKGIGDSVLEVAIIDKNGETTVLDRNACEFGYRTSRIIRERLPVVWARVSLDGEPYDRVKIVSERRARQPLSARSAGCIFKNTTSLPAGFAIDKAGLKGYSIGMAKVSDKHANFIVNLGGAKGAEIRRLIDIVRQKVYKSFRISLELEIEVIEG